MDTNFYTPISIKITSSVETSLGSCWYTAVLTISFDIIDLDCCHHHSLICHFLPGYHLLLPTTVEKVHLSCSLEDQHTTMIHEETQLAKSE